MQTLFCVETVDVISSREFVNRGTFRVNQGPENSLYESLKFVAKYQVRVTTIFYGKIDFRN